MNVKRVWLECEDENGNSFMAPATPEDLKALQRDEENNADIKTHRDFEMAGQF